VSRSFLTREIHMKEIRPAGVIDPVLDKQRTRHNQNYHFCYQWRMAYPPKLLASASTARKNITGKIF